jgi:predicted DNA-binding transcriptional regulator AlpA
VSVEDTGVEDLRLVYTLQQCAVKFGRDVRTITRWEEEGEFPKRLNFPVSVDKRGRRRFKCVAFDRAEVDVWWQELHGQKKVG